MWQCKVQERTVRDIAHNLSVSSSTVSRIVDRFDRTGDVARSSATSRDHVLHQHDEFLLVGWVLENPGKYLHELQQLLVSTTGTEASVTTIFRSLKNFGFSRKKIQRIALQRSEVVRSEYMAEMVAFDTSMLVFIDETGSDKRNALRKFGYALRGQRATSHTILSRGRRISAIGAMCSSGMFDCYTVDGTVDADEFYKFMQGLLKHRMPFNGSNPNSVVVLDNCTIHHVPGVN